MPANVADRSTAKSRPFLASFGSQQGHLTPLRLISLMVCDLKSSIP